jgi:hypothetical protein
MLAILPRTRELDVVNFYPLNTRITNIPKLLSPLERELNRIKSRLQSSNHLLTKSDFLNLVQSKGT